MHFTPAIALLGASATLATAASTGHYFTLSSINSNTPSGLTTPSYDTITFPLLDSAAKNPTTCTVSWDWSKKPPTSYTACKNNSYQVQVSNYTDITDFNVNIKHIYDSKSGKSCDPTKKGCVSTLGLAAVNSRAAAFKSYCGGSGACGAVSSGGMKVGVLSSTTGTK